MATSLRAAAPIRFSETEPLLVRKLGYCLRLSRTERDAIARLLSLDVRTVRRRTLLLEAGEAANKLGFMLSGWAKRYKTLSNGRRQIVAFYLPGDVCDFSIFMAPALDSTIELVEGARVAGISRAQLGLLSRTHPRITRGLWWESQAAASIQREWLINVTQRSATERVAHLICEIVTRLEAVGLADDKNCRLPLTQTDFGEACGMTTAHTNRTLRELRDGGLAVWRDGLLEVSDWERLVCLADFDPAYLQFQVKEEGLLAGARKHRSFNRTRPDKKPPTQIFT